MTSQEEPFSPKQASPKNADLYAEIVGDSTSNLAKHLLTLIPPFDSSAIIHDNGCGNGEVSSQIMATSPPASITIHATDMDPTMLANCASLASSKNWPITTSFMPAQALSFASNTFTHSLTNLLIFHTPNDGLDCASEIYRTLKPDGVAILTTFKEIPHQEVIKSVHRKLRGPDIPLPHGMPDHWYQAEHLKSVLEEGGFESDKVILSEADVFTQVKDLRPWVQILWSYVGAPASGWTRKDEKDWDKAVDMIVEELEKSETYERKKDGKGGVLKMLANVAVARK